MEYLMKNKNKSNQSNYSSVYKNEIKKIIGKVTDKMQIIVIGCICQPPKVNSKDLDIFTKKIFFPIPSFGDLKIIWS